MADDIESKNILNLQFTEDNNIEYGNSLTRNHDRVYKFSNTLQRIKSLVDHYVHSLPTRVMLKLHTKFNDAKNDKKFEIEKQMHEIYLKYHPIKYNNTKEHERCAKVIFEYYIKQSDDDTLLDEAFELQKLVHTGNKLIHYTKWINLITAATKR